METPSAVYDYQQKVEEQVVHDLVPLLPTAHVESVVEEEEPEPELDFENGLAEKIVNEHHLEGTTASHSTATFDEEAYMDFVIKLVI